MTSNPQTEARAIALDTWLKSFTVYSVEDDESSIRLSINGQQIACWGDTSPQGIALLQFDAGHREAATAFAAKDAELAEVIKTGFERCADITARAERAEAGERAAHDAANTAIRQRDEARAQLAEANKALEPLWMLADAVFRDGMNSRKPDDAGVWGFDNATLTYGHLRTARRAREQGGENV